MTKLANAIGVDVGTLRAATLKPRGPHCELCQQPNPKTDDGYTTCCNELVCDCAQTSACDVCKKPIACRRAGICAGCFE